MSRKLEVPDLDYLVGRYLAGESLKHLSDSTGISRPAMRRAFQRIGVHIRGQSEAESLKWEELKRNRKAVERQCSAAWKAATGRVHSLDEKIQRAKTNYERLLHRGKHEDEIAQSLKTKGLDAVCGFPVGTYNIDVAIRCHRIAVEVQSGYLDRGKSVCRKRLEHLFDNGWSVLIVHTPKRHIFSLRTVVEKIIAFTKAAGRDHSVRRQYGVVRGDGKIMATRHFDSYGWSRVPGF